MPSLSPGVLGPVEIRCRLRHLGFVHFHRQTRAWRIKRTHARQEVAAASWLRSAVHAAYPDAIMTGSWQHEAKEPGVLYTTIAFRFPETGFTQGAEGRPLNARAAGRAAAELHRESGTVAVAGDSAVTGGATGASRDPRPMQPSGVEGPAFASEEQA